MNRSNENPADTSKIARWTLFFSSATGAPAHVVVALANFASDKSKAGIPAAVGF